MDAKILKEIGLTDGEIRVYLTLIQYGESTIGPIAKKAKVTAAKTYPILDRLKQKGLVSEVRRANTLHFQALHPSRLVDFVREKKERIEEQEDELKKLIPQLANLHGEPEQYASVYEGMNGLKTLYEDMLAYHVKTGTDFICFTLGEEYENDQANRFFKKYDRKRFDAGIKMRIIGLENQRAFYEKEYGHEKRIQYRFMKQAIPTGVIIYGDNVVTLLWKKEPTAFVIHSKENADVYRKFFEDAWNA